MSRKVLPTNNASPAVLVVALRRTMDEVLVVRLSVAGRARAMSLTTRH